jgi:conjugative transposon TraN protein
MKTLKLLIITFIILTAASAQAQFNTEAEYTNVQLSYLKTTSILFPYSIKSLDIGSRDVLVQKAKGMENILLLKAGVQNFKQTNLTVVTSDGRLYVFLLDYDEEFPQLNIKAENSVVASKEILFSGENDNQKKTEQLAGLALLKKRKNIKAKSSKYLISLEINGAFIYQDVLYFRVVFENRSQINYDIDQFRFYIRDQKKSKRTASQEIEILPLYTTSSSAVIPDKSQLTKVYALEKFTIPEGKYLTLQLIEKNGGRHLEVNIRDNMINKAAPIKDFNDSNF